MGNGQEITKNRGNGSEISMKMGNGSDIKENGKWWVIQEMGNG